MAVDYSSWIEESPANATLDWRDDDTESEITSDEDDDSAPKCRTCGRRGHMRRSSRLCPEYVPPAERARKRERAAQETDGENSDDDDDNDDDDDSRASPKRRRSRGKSRSPNPFNIFSKFNRQLLQEQHPDVRGLSVAVELAKRWREMPAEQRLAWASASPDQLPPSPFRPAPPAKTAPKSPSMTPPPAPKSPSMMPPPKSPAPKSPSMMPAAKSPAPKSPPLAQPQPARTPRPTRAMAPRQAKSQ